MASGIYFTFLQKSFDGRGYGSLGVRVFTSLLKYRFFIAGRTAKVLVLCFPAFLIKSAKPQAAANEYIYILPELRLRCLARQYVKHCPSKLSTTTCFIALLTPTPNATHQTLQTDPYWSSILHTWLFAYASDAYTQNNTKSAPPAYLISTCSPAAVLHTILLRSIQVSGTRLVKQWLLLPAQPSG